jgi:hypothetical protein
MELAMHGHQHATPDDSEEEDSDSDDEDRPPPKEIGDVDPSRCKVSGPGFSGAAAGVPVPLYLHAHDAWGRRLTKGGDEVVVRVTPASSSMAVSGAINVNVVDNGNGTYTASYTAPVKGNYFIAVEVNYLPISGSPFPVFFSNPVDPSEAEAAAAAALAAAGGPGAAQASMNPAVAAMAAAAKQALGTSSSQSDEQLRTVYASGLSSAIALEQYRQLFSIAGKIKDIKQQGEGATAMLVLEYETVVDADEAVKMSGMAVGDRSLVVQNGVQYQQSIAPPPALSLPGPPGMLPGMLGVPLGLPGMMPMGGVGLLPGMMPGMMPGLPDPLLALQQMQQMQDIQRMQVRVLLCCEVICCLCCLC